MNKLAVIVVLALLVAAASRAPATPAFAAKEGKQCAYCHISPAGGGPRNFRGLYYAAHNHSFAGFVEPLAFKQAWTQTFTDSPSRVAAGDFNGDGKTRVLLVAAGKNADSRTLSILSWDQAAQKLQQDATIPTDRAADRMILGRFGLDRSFAMVTPSTIIVAQNGAYKSHDTTDTAHLMGALRLKGGDEAFLTLDGDKPGTHKVDPKADDWLADGPPLPTSAGTGVLWGDVRSPGEGQEYMVSEIARQIHVPGDLTGLGFFGAWDVRNDGHVFYYMPQHKTVGDAAEDTVVFYPLPNPQDENPPTAAWTSPKFPGRVLDIAPGTDPRDGRASGLYVLVDGANGGAKARTLYFFTLG